MCGKGTFSQIRSHISRVTYAHACILIYVTADRAYTCRNPKRHIPPVSLLLWHKVVTMRCFVWALGLRLWSGSEAVRLKLEFLAIFKNLYLATCKCFVEFNAVLCIIWTSTIP